MDKIEIKTIQDIKDYVKSLDTPKNKVYQQNSLLIMSCFSKAIEFIEQNAKLRQPAVIKSVCEICADYEDGDSDNITCTKCKRKVRL